MNSETEQSFWEKVDKNGSNPIHLPHIDQCWKWNAFKDDHGYGMMRTQNPRGKPLFSHRISWLIHFGGIPNGKHVLHKCDNPECANPNHLFLGTQKDNMADRQKKNRQPKGESQGSSKLSTEEVVEIKKSHKPISELASRYGVGTSQIRRIKAGIQWKHIKSDSPHRSATP